MEAALGERLVATRDSVRPRAPGSQVAATEIAAAHEEDAAIGFGGVSAIRPAKAIGRPMEELRTGCRADASSSTGRNLIPVIAVSDHLGWVADGARPQDRASHGRTRPARKVAVADPEGAPKLTSDGPLLTLDCRRAGRGRQARDGARIEALRCQARRWRGSCAAERQWL